MTVFEQVIEFVSAHPGKTGGEIAKGILGPDAEQPRVNPDLNKALKSGHLRREGKGGANDPYRYYLNHPHEDRAPQAEPDRELDRKLAVLEERMNTMQAQYEGALDRLRADIARDIARQGEMIAQRDAETARRELRITLTILGAVGLAVAILGFLIRLS